MVNWSNIRNVKNFDDNKDLVNTINEQKIEQKKLIDQFNSKMNVFATERSIESCLDALNITIQLSNVRGELIKCYEYYSKELESKIVQLNRIIEKYHQPDH
jgi:hypothetical protein